MAIVKSSELNFNSKNIIMIISGLPGVGKTTLALSAPDAVLVDTDEGIVRVNPAHRKDSSQVTTYEELKDDIKSFAGRYKTVIIDTCGAMIDLLKDWAARTEPASATKKSGGFSQQGYGIVKSEFMRLSAELRKSFNVIFLFHAFKDKIGEDVFYDIVCEGSAKTMVWQPADLGAYMHIVNGERYLGFTPTMNYSAKSAYGIKGLVKVPELQDGQENNFLTVLFEKVRENIAAETNKYGSEKSKYDKAMAEGKAIISAIEKPEDIAEAGKKINALDHALSSLVELRAAVKPRMLSLGYVLDKATKTYVKSGDPA